MTGKQEQSGRPRVRKPAAVRRAELLAAATEVLRVRGVEAVTVEEITAGAGVSKGSFYLHFRSKEELLDALRLRLGEELAAEVAALERPRQRREWAAFTRRFVRRAIEVQVERAESHALLTEVSHGHEDADGEDPRNPAERVLASFIEAGVTAGAYRVEDVDAAVRLLFALVHAAGDWACDEPEALDRIAAAAGALTLRGLRGEPGPLPQSPPATPLADSASGTEDRCAAAAASWARCCSISAHNGRRMSATQMAPVNARTPQATHATE